MSDIKILTVNTKQLAELFGVSEGYISDLVNDHGMPKIGFNEFNLFDCVKFRFSHLEKIFEDQKNKLRDLTNRGRLDAANAELKELELQVKKGSLVPAIEFEMALRNEIMIFKKGIESFAITLKYDLDLSTEQVKIVEENANSLLTQLSELPPGIKAEDVNLNKK